ncbi:MAG: C10 family peptidase [Bacteroidales bacterium]|nr:C10 family peptidase [Bacteroidales bacterium]
MKRFFLLLAVLMTVVVAKAESVSRVEAEQVARAFYYRTVGEFKEMPWNKISLTAVVDPNDKDAKYNLYIFDVNDNDGYIVVSSDKQITPVLAYSFSGSFNIDNMSPGQAGYIQYYSESNTLAASVESDFAPKNLKLWEKLLNYTPGTREANDVVSSGTPLLDGIVWSQDYPFNQGCPTPTSASGGDHGHTYVGCVATATCHIMKYWNWPATGNGAKSLSSASNGGHGTITVNFANQTYDWTAIPDEPTVVNDEVSKICFHVGVGLGMNWGNSGSGTYTWNVPSALKSYFRFDNTVAYKKKSSYSESNWNQLLKSQIDSKLPMVYAGSSTAAGAGHAWNCDAYQITDGEYKFNMQWGWGRNGGNGYYTLDNLHSTAVSGGEENNFVEDQEVVINMRPNTEFEACNSIVATGFEGSFDDGSRINDYANNMDCTYVINPACGAVVSASFTKFDLAEGDYINVFSGDETSTDLIATYDRDNPPSHSFNSYKGAITLNFHTDGSATASGWKVEYSSKYCSSTRITLTDPSGTFGDGSKACQYNKSTSCEWKIAPEGATFVKLNFANFNLADDGKDYVAVYKTNTNTDNQIVKYYGNNVPSEPINVTTLPVIVKFYSNSDANVGEGWVINYTSSESSIDEVDILSNLTVMPNPANNDSKITFTLTDASSANISVTNMIGQVVGGGNFDLEPGYHEIAVSDILNADLHNGVYFVSLQNGRQVMTCKFVFVK